MLEVKHLLRWDDFDCNAIKMSSGFCNFWIALIQHI